MKKILLSVIGLLVLSVLAYSAGWFYLAGQLEKKISAFYDGKTSDGDYQFYGEKPSITGFPTMPVITYTKGLKFKNIDITFDSLTVKGYPFVGKPMIVEAEKVAVKLPNKEVPYSFNLAALTFTQPEYFPNQITSESLSQWQKDVGQIEFSQIYLDKNGMIFNAKGPIGLDSNLQPTATLDTQIIDYIEFLRFIAVETDQIPTVVAAMANSLLNGIAKTDEATGKRYVELPVSVKDRKLALKGFQLIRFPAVSWPVKQPE